MKTPEEKECKKCLDKKPITEFYEGKALCKACYNIGRRRYRKHGNDIDRFMEVSGKEIF